MPFNPLKCTCGEREYNPHIYHIIQCLPSGYYLPQRYVVCFFIFLGIVVAYSQRLSFNLALTAMVEKKVKNATECPDLDAPLKVSVFCFLFQHICMWFSLKAGGKTFRWSEETQSQLLGAFYGGYFLMHIPAGVMSDIFGAKHTFAQGIMLGAIAHGLTPIAIDYGGMFILYCLRFFIGMSQVLPN